MEDVEPSFDGLADGVALRADLRELVADLGRLPEDQRAALVLFELGGLSQAEIASSIGVPAGKVKALVFQARAELMAERDARSTPCATIREELAVARGGALRRGPLRRHLNHCEPCQAYRAAVATQRAGFALILPVAPAIGLKAGVLAAIAGKGALDAAAAAGRSGAGGRRSGGARRGAGGGGDGAGAAAAAPRTAAARAAAARRTARVRAAAARRTPAERARRPAARRTPAERARRAAAARPVRRTSAAALRAARPRPAGRRPVRRSRRRWPWRSCSSVARPSAASTRSIAPRSRPG